MRGSQLPCPNPNPASYGLADAVNSECALSSFLGILPLGALCGHRVPSVG